MPQKLLTKRTNLGQIAANNYLRLTTASAGLSTTCRHALVGDILVCKCYWIHESESYFSSARLQLEQGTAFLLLERDPGPIVW